MAARTTLHHYFAAGTGRRPSPAAGSGAACRTSSASGREEAAPPPPPSPPRPAGRRRGREKGGRGWRGIRRPPPPPPLAPLFATPRGAGSASSAGTLGPDTLGPGPARSRSGTLVTPSPVPGRGRNRRKRARAGSAPSEGRAGDGGSGGGGGGGGTKRQMYLDLGQATFASRTVCPTCGMLYVHGLAEDAAAHERVCSEHRVGVPFRGWKGERVVARWEGGKGQASGEEGGGRIVEVRPDDPARHRALVRRVKAIVDGEMGFADGGGGTGDEGDDAGGASSSSSSSLFGRTAYLCVAGGTVVGLCTVEVLATAHRLLGGEEEEEGPVPVPAVPNLRRSLLPTRAGMGIHQLWCHPTHRKGGVATRLVDAARSRLVYGMTVPADLVAFSSPTGDGLAFARRYSGTGTPLVYDCL